MKVSRGDRIRGLYEYTFWSVINDYNEGQKNTGNPDLITTSEGRALHAKMMQEIERHLLAQKDDKAPAQRAHISSIGPNRFITAANTALRERMGRDAFPVTDNMEYKNQPQYRKALGEYRQMMGMDASTDEVGDENFYPVSPYDERFAMNECVLNNGSRLGGIRGWKFNEAGEMMSLDSLMEIKNAKDLQFSSNVRQRTNRDGSVEWLARDVEGVTLIGDNDMTGLAQLKSFMTTDEYNKVAGWVAKGVDVDNMTPAAMKKRDEGLARSVAILKGLKEMGRSYTISPDLNTGQIKARIDNTRVDVRIMDRPGNEGYIGKVYDNGASVMYSSTYFGGRGEGRMAVEPTPEEALNLVRFSLGMPLKQNQGDQLVGHNEQIDRVERRASKKINSAFHTKGGRFTATTGLAVGPNGKLDTTYRNRMRIVFDGKRRSAETTEMLTETDADNYLRDAVASARENFTNELNAEALIEDWKANHDVEGWEPSLSGNPDMAVVQRSYIDLLEGRRSTLLRPKVDPAEYDELLSEAGEFDTSDAASMALYEHRMAELTYLDDMPAEDIIKLHVHDSVEDKIGNYQRDENGKRFNPVGVSAYQTSVYSVYRNNDDIIKSMRMLGITADEVKGDDFYNKTVKNRLVKFDFATAKPMKDEIHPFYASMYDEIKTSLDSNGLMFDENDIKMDDNGIVHYTGKIATTEGYDPSKFEVVEGEIGQLFAPDEHGVVRTKFNSGDNYAFVPGYEASILPKEPGNPQSVEARTRLKGYEQSMRDNIRYRIRQDMLVASEGTLAGAPTNVNDTYRHLHDERHDIDFVEQYKEQGMPEDFLWAIVETEAARVRYGNDVRDGSTTHAEYMAKTYGMDLANDNAGDAFAITGGRNMARLTAEADGYFDPIATTATSTNQGCLRYLVAGSKVDVDGRIIPSDDKNARCALMSHPFMENAKYDPFDRVCMTISNVMQASALTDPVNIVQTQVEGWNMDDGFVVSKKFAEEYKMRNHDGHMRDLVVGDKLSDGHGNKGVISLIVDPNMSDAEAEAQGILNPVKMMRANPDLDIAMPLFSGPSRFNAGTGREMLNGKKQDFVDINGKVHESAIGQMRIIITDKSADAKTHVYDDDEIAAGNGRKASAQLAWALNSKEASAIMNECYGNNGSTLSNIREMLITTGLDMDETGHIHRGYEPHTGEVRRVIEMPGLEHRVRKDGTQGSLDKKAMLEKFSDTIARSGGIMELPFELKYPTGDPIPPLNDGKTDVVYKKEEWTRKGYTRKDGTYVKPTTVRRRQDAGQRQTENVSWGLPVMSSYLRSGQSFSDGTSSTHDYTHQYEDIFMDACEYRNAQERLKDGSLTDKQRRDYEAIVEDKPKRAQARFDRITGDVKTRAFTGKHNVFRDNIMSHRMPNSATAVWTEDPRLDIDEVAVGRGMADTIGLSDGDYTLIWRDPILRDGGLRYMKVKVDDNLTGVAINPVMDKCFDGDFDGDTVGVVNLKTKAAQKEAFEKFSVQANLLDYGSGKEGEYDLGMQESLDIKLAEYHNPEIAQCFNDMKTHINEFEVLYSMDEIGKKEVDKLRSQAAKDMSQLYQDSFAGECGTETLSFKDVQSHVESIHKTCVETGAKGNTAKVKGYMRWLGVTCPEGSEIDFANIQDTGDTLATREDHQQVMDATAVKSHGTGIGGSFSQRGVSALRNSCQTAVLELTYPVTQSLLQSKHDAAEAKAKYEMLMGPARYLWQGAQLDRDDNGGWKVQRDDKGYPIPARVEDWKDTFIQMYTSGTKDGGLNVSINEKWVNQVAKALTDESGYMKNIESSDFEMTAPLDKLAYGGSFDKLVAMADERTDIFAGKFNSQFAPRIIKTNRKAFEQEMQGVEDAKPMKSLTKSDTLESGKDRNTVRQKPVAVGGPKPRNGLDITGLEAAADSSTEYEG